MHHSHSSPVLYPTISDKGFQVWLGNRKLSSHPASGYFDHIHGQTILDWHISHLCFPACYARCIDWDVCAAALQRLPTGSRRWVAKHTSGFCGVGTKMVKWKEQPAVACPRCGKDENARHVWLCQEPAVFFVWALLMSSLSAWLLESVHTAMATIFWIIRHLESFSSVCTDLPGLSQVIKAQDSIGWQAFFEGCIAIKWAGVQDTHFLWLGRRNTGKLWATSLVIKLWEVVWDLWDHRNQAKYNLKMAQDIARRDSILLAVRSEFSFGCSALP
jgi:hypothetical protein